MVKVKKNDFIEITYTGSLKDDGTVFDSSEGKEPISFITSSRVKTIKAGSQATGLRSLTSRSLSWL